MELKAPRPKASENLFWSH